MPAIVRVKRRIDEEPLNAFVLNGKKRRLADGIASAGTEQCAQQLDSFRAASEKDEISTILKFAGTVPEQDDSVVSEFARLTKAKAKQLVQEKSQPRMPVSHTERARKEMRQSLHENRFRVVNCLRTTLTDGEAQNADSGEITIVDIEKQSDALSPSAASDMGSFEVTIDSSVFDSPTPEQHAVADSDTGYVYDLYLPENEQQASEVDLMNDNYLRVRAFDDLVYAEHYAEEEEEYDSEDSNQENHAGNDYPDEDDDAELNGACDGAESEGEREMRLAVEGFVLDDDDDEEEAAGNDSSDDEDINPYRDPYVHTVDLDDEDDCSFVDDIDFYDVDRYGAAYARYKARVLNDKYDDDDDDVNSEKED